MNEFMSVREKLVSIHHVAIGKSRVGRPKSMRGEKFVRIYHAQVVWICLVEEQIRESTVDMTL